MCGVVSWGACLHVVVGSQVMWPHREPGLGAPVAQDPQLRLVQLVSARYGPPESPWQVFLPPISANHGVSDVTVVGHIAVVIGHNRDGNLLEVSARFPPSGSPSGAVRRFLPRIQLLPREPMVPTCSPMVAGGLEARAGKSLAMVKLS